MATGTRSRRWAWWGAAIGLLLALLFFAPARWLNLALFQATQGQLQLVNARGTLWNGRGDLVLSGGEGSRGQTALPQGIRWKLGPGWSRGPALRAKLTSPCCTEQPVTLRLRPRWGGADVKLDAFNSRWPAAILIGLGTPWNTLYPDGRLQIQSPGFSIAWTSGRIRMEGRLQAQVQDLSTRVSTVRPLGSYQIELQARADSDEASLELKTLEGKLLLQGQGQWVGGRLRFRGEASAAPGHEAALINLLNIIGIRDGARSVLAFG
ncbi:MAG: type II secretion system protein N [Hydrogenophaga sp.]|nr:type II secretion system protein N [Hydrogenophaga sp.]